MQTTRFLTILLASCFVPTIVSAQVFDLGPSDSSLFTNVIEVPMDASPSSVGGVAGETTQLNLADGGTLVSFFDVDAGAEVNISGGFVGDFLQSVVDSEVNISGGFIDENFGVLGGVVNISGGEVGDAFLAGNGSLVNISGGEVGFFFDATFDSEVNITGGIVGDFFDARPGSVVNISGGTVGDEFLALSDSVVNISGGTVGTDFLAGGGSNINLFGSNFALNGVMLEDLVEGEAFTIADRDVTLTGLFTDGSAFSFDLNSTSVFAQDQFLPDANLTVTLSTDFLLGDVNQDGAVNFSDISSFISVLSTSGFQAEADINGDGDVNFSDIGPFISLLAS